MEHRRVVLSFVSKSSAQAGSVIILLDTMLGPNYSSAKENGFIADCGVTAMGLPDVEGRSFFGRFKDRLHHESKKDPGGRYFSVLLE